MKPLLLLILMLAALSGCATNPVSGRQDFVMMSESDEVSMGRQSDLQVRKQYGVYDDPALQAYVNRVGQRLARNSHRPNLEYHFTVLDSPEVNAFALPGGYIYITRGILPYLDSEAELAAVLGHEIGHVTARHSVKQYTAAMTADIGVQIASIFVPEINTPAGANLVNVTGSALLSGYGREQELQADKLGSEYLARTGYDPHAMISVLSTLKDQEAFDIARAKEEHREPRVYHGVFASHPDSDTRLQQVVNESKNLQVSPHPLEGRRIYLEHIDGIVFGDSPSQGVVRNSKFMHAGLGIALKFPQGWIIRNGAQSVQATNGDAVIEFSMADGQGRSPADYLIGRYGQGSLTRFDTRNFSGATLLYSSRAESAAISMNGKLYLIAAAAKTPAAFGAARPEIEETVHSFHAMNPLERKLAQGLKISLRQAKAGDTFERYAAHSPLGKHAAGYLRLLNHAYPDGEPVPGEEIKLVE